ncbi:hypothetical protein [Runella limosa]|uniref:hypothetical protein n=1 Tax=Runella limosa TaxID=370978 RepID=UPI0003F85380|nr:hypothetical protein [Runella limosa]
MTFFNLSIQKRFLVSLCLLPLVIYVVFFEAIALNANYVAYDDIHVLQIVEQWQNAASWRDKLDWLTIGFPEHRIVFTRLVVLLSYWLTGSVNFKTLMVISNLLWVGQLGILFKVFQKLNLSFAYFIPLCWIVLNVHSFENIFWGTSSLGNFGLLFFTMMAAYGYTQLSPKYSWIGILFSVFATFSYGNGLLTFLIGGTILALSKRWKEMKLTLGAFVLTMGLYSLTHSHASPSSLDLTKAENYLQAIICFLAFIGSSVNFDAYSPSTLAQWLSVVFGGVLLTVNAWALFRHTTITTNPRTITLRLNKVQWFALYMLLFVCLTSLGVVYKRAEWDGLYGMFKGRYRMYPTWMLILTYLLVLDWNREKITQKWLAIGMGIVVIFNTLVLYYAIAPAVNNRRMAVAQEFNSMYNADLLGLKMFDLTGTDFLRLQKLYQPSLFFRQYEKQWTASTDSLSTNGNFKVDSVFWSNKNLSVYYHRDFIRPVKNMDDGAYVVLKSASHVYMAGGMQQALPLKTFLRRGWYWDRGFMATFVPGAVVKGNYRMYVLLRQNGVSELLDTQKQVTF